MYNYNNKNKFDLINDLERGVKFKDYRFDDFRSDFDVVIKAVEYDGSAVDSINKNFKNNKQIAYVSIAKNPWTILKFDEEIQNDFTACIIAVSKFPQVYKYLNEDMQKYSSIVQKVMELTNNDFELLSDEVKEILQPIKHKIGTFEIDYSDYLPIYNFDNPIRTIEKSENINDIEYLEIQIENLKKELQLKKSIKNKIVLDIKKLIKEHNLTTNDLF